MVPPTPEELLEMIRLKKELEKKEKRAELPEEDKSSPQYNESWERTPWEH